MRSGQTCDWRSASPTVRPATAASCVNPMIMKRNDDMRILPAFDNVRIADSSILSKRNGVLTSAGFSNFLYVSLVLDSVGSYHSWTGQRSPSPRGTHDQRSDT